jgi:hypothetical protein
MGGPPDIDGCPPLEEPTTTPAAPRFNATTMAPEEPERPAVEQQPQQNVGQVEVTLRSGTWTINGNGYIGQLVISSVDSTGRLSGTVYGNDIRDGFWDEDAQKITFTRITQADDPSTFQKYTGYLFWNPIGSPQPGRDITYTLTGYFEALPGSGGTPERPLYGWYAQQVVIS